MWKCASCLATKPRPLRPLKDALASLPKDCSPGRAHRDSSLHFSHGVMVLGLEWLRAPKQDHSGRRVSPSQPTCWLLKAGGHEMCPAVALAPPQVAGGHSWPAEPQAASTCVLVWAARQESPVRLLGEAAWTPGLLELCSPPRISPPPLSGWPCVLLCPCGD